MSKYFQAMERRKRDFVSYADSSRMPPAEVVERHQRVALAPVVESQGLLESLAGSRSLRDFTEQLGAASAHSGSARILIAGCRPGDGVSTIAAAIALDMSQRLAARTVLVQAQPQGASIHSIFGRGAIPSAITAPASIAVQATGLPRLETARPEQVALADRSPRLIEDLDIWLPRYRLAVFDLGVVRLDPRMLTFARPDDPILVVARHLHTDREEMIATVNVLGNAGQLVAGVILNAYQSPLPRLVKRFAGVEV
jgi:Mrp family chromosome partitioning ATPase